MSSRTTSISRRHRRQQGQRGLAVLRLDHVVALLLDGAREELPIDAACRRRPGRAGRVGRSCRRASQALAQRGRDRRRRRPRRPRCARRPGRVRLAAASSRPRGTTPRTPSPPGSRCRLEGVGGTASAVRVVRPQPGAASRRAGPGCRRGRPPPARRGTFDRRPPSPAGCPGPPSSSTSSGIGASDRRRSASPRGRPPARPAGWAWRRSRPCRPPGTARDRRPGRWPSWPRCARRARLAGLAGADLPRRLQAVQLGHLHVHQHDVVAAAPPSAWTASRPFVADIRLVPDLGQQSQRELRFTALSSASRMRSGWRSPRRGPAAGGARRLAPSPTGSRPSEHRHQRVMQRGRLDRLQQERGDGRRRPGRARDGRSTRG